MILLFTKGDGTGVISSGICLVDVLAVDCAKSLSIAFALTTS